MTTHRTHYSLDHLGPFENLPDGDFPSQPGKHFVGKVLGLTGCEASINRMPPGKATPFVHAHKKNEELYIFLRGSGIAYIDGDEFPVQEGSVLRVAPDGARALTAGNDGLHFICIQAQAGSLTQATFDDGYIVEATPSWMGKQGA